MKRKLHYSKFASYHFKNRNLTHLTKKIVLATILINLTYSGFAQENACYLMRSDYIYEARENRDYYVETVYDDQKRKIGDYFYNIDDGSLSLYYLDELNNAGKVEKRNWYDASDNITKYILYEYENDTLETREVGYLPDESIDYERNFHYNEKGQVIKKEYSSKGEPYDYTTYTYHDFGKVATFSIHNPSTGEVQRYFDYEYNADNNMIKYNAYDANKTLTGYYTFDYNANKRRIKDSYYTAEGVLDFYVVHTYDCQ